MRETLTELKSRLHAAGASQEAYERSTINLIASDNLIPAWRQHDLPYHGDMIQEGIVGYRPFAGAALHDEIENVAADVAKAVFGTDHAILQSHSCSQANQAVYHALLKPGDRVLALQFKAGGHLTHGMKGNFSGRLYDFRFFGVNEEGRIDYDAVRFLAREARPGLIVCGSSSYPWAYDVASLRGICDEVGAWLMLDVSHEGGLIAGSAFACDLRVPDVVTMSLDKTLRGAHGAAILCTAALAERLDSAVHPGTQSSFPIRRLTDSAVALLETQTEMFAEYAARAVGLARHLSSAFTAAYPGAVFGGGTDKHYLLLDSAAAFGCDGIAAERALERVGVLANRQTLPSARSSRLRDADGLRVGTAWAASAGYTLADAEKLAEIVAGVLSRRVSDAEAAAAVAGLVAVKRELDVRTRVLP